MIAHAWTVVCDRARPAAEGDGLELSTLETIFIDKSDDGEPALVPCRLEVVSLWYRRDPQRPARGRANLCVSSPDGAVLASLPLDLDLSTAARCRTRSIFDGLLVRDPGAYLFTIDLLDATPATEVARVPLFVELRPAATSTVTP